MKTTKHVSYQPIANENTFKIMRCTLPRVVSLQTLLRFKNIYNNPVNRNKKKQDKQGKYALTAATVSMSNTLVQYRQALAFPYLVWHSSRERKKNLNNENTMTMKHCVKCI